MKDITENGSDHCEWIYSGMSIEMPVFFGNNGFPQQRRNFFQFSFHAPLLVFGKEGIYHFSLIISDQCRIFNIIRKRKNPVQDEEQNDQRQKNDKEIQSDGKAE